MTKKNLSITIAVGFIALFGIIAVQIHWIYTAYSQNKISFEQNLNKALNQIVHDLSRQENVFFSDGFENEVRFIDKNSEIIHLDSAIKNRTKWSYRLKREDIKGLKEADILHFKTDNSKPRKKLRSIQSETHSKGKIIIRTVENDIEIIQEYHLDSLADNIETEFELKASAMALITKDSLLKKYEDRIDSVRKLLDYNIFTIASEKEDLNKTMVELFMNIKSVTRPFAERIPIDKLQSSIEKAIIQFDLPKSYAFAIVTSPDDSILLKTDNFNPKELGSAYSIRLFPHDLVSRSELFYISFPDANPLFSQMLWPVTLAFIFTLLLLASLLIIIHNLMHHKKISAIKTDFINNMTHEFKTPIATIQLASDSVMNKQIINDTEKINYFMGMIKSENKRMNALVERILQMAQLEKKSFSLIKSEVDMHQLIEAVVENSQLQIEQIGGEIKINLKAEQALVEIDEMHITNVLFNLIDNAIKYRSEHLLIEIITSIRKRQFVISVNDNGPGMTKEIVAHIFDKFYRLTEGDVHTIKGYGLGLSYVKAIIDKHHGQINVQSEPGIGSRFEISLPVKQ